MRNLEKREWEKTRQTPVNKANQKHLGGMDTFVAIGVQTRNGNISQVIRCFVAAERRNGVKENTPLLPKKGKKNK